MTDAEYELLLGLGIVQVVLITLVWVVCLLMLTDIRRR